MKCYVTQLGREFLIEGPKYGGSPTQTGKLVGTAIANIQANNPTPEVMAAKRAQRKRIFHKVATRQEDLYAAERDPISAFKGGSGGVGTGRSPRLSRDQETAIAPVVAKIRGRESTKREKEDAAAERGDTYRLASTRMTNAYGKAKRKLGNYR